MVLIQAIKNLPKSIRINCSVFWLGKFANLKKVCEDLYEEISSTITEDKFMDVYNYCISQDYGSLVIDLTNQKPRFLLNWDKELVIN